MTAATGDDGVVKSRYPKRSKDTNLLPRLLRIHFIQQRFTYVGPTMEDALYESESMHRFTGVGLKADLVLRTVEPAWCASCCHDSTAGIK